MTVTNLDVCVVSQKRFRIQIAHFAVSRGHVTVGLQGGTGA